MTRRRSLAATPSTLLHLAPPPKPAAPKPEPARVALKPVTPSMTITRISRREPKP